MPTQKQREARDVGCCLIFFLVVAASGGALFYAYQKGNPWGFLGIEDSSGQNCGVDVSVKTQPYLYICPDQQNEFSAAATTVCVDACPASEVAPSFCHTGYATQASSSLVCIPKPGSSYWQKLEGSNFKFMVTVSDHLNNISRTWALLLLLTPVLSFGLGLVLLRAMRSTARCVFWLCLATVVVGSAVLGVYFLQEHFSKGSTMGRDLFHGMLGLSIAALALFVTCTARRSIARSFFFLEAAGECLTDSVAMLLQPIFECFKKVVLALLFLFGVASLLSCHGRMQPAFLYGMALFVLFVFAWLVECMGTLSRFITGYLSQEWFFSTYDSTLNQKLMPVGSIAEAYGIALQYHWGSLCFGALANMLLKPVRVVLRVIMVVTKSCNVCSQVRGYYKQIVPYGDSAYLAIALEGHSYLVACSEASEILGNERVQEITWLDDMLIEMQVLMSCAISFWVTLAVWFCLAQPEFNDTYSDRYLDDKEFVVVVAFLVSQLFIWPFLECIAQVADGLLFCYRAGSGGYLGIAAMVSERTGLFHVDCVGGPETFMPFTHHPPKLTEMLVYLNEGPNA